MPSMMALRVQPAGSHGTTSCRDNSADKASSLVFSSEVRCPSRTASSILASFDFNRKYSSLVIGPSLEREPRYYGPPRGFDKCAGCDKRHSGRRQAKGLGLAGHEP